MAALTFCAYCTAKPAPLDPATNSDAFLSWVAGYASIRFTLPECGYFTPGFLVQNQGDMATVRALSHTKYNSATGYVNLPVHLLGCTPLTVTNPAIPATYNLTYHSNRVIKSRVDNATFKTLTSSLDADDRVTTSSDDCVTAGTITHIYTYDSLNRLLEDRSLDDPACSWTADQSDNQYAGLDRLPSRGSYADNTGLVMDAVLLYQYTNGLITGVDWTCVGGSGCPSLSLRYTYDTNGRLITENDLINSTTTTYTYYSDGRLATVTTSTDLVTYTYNALGQISSVTQTDGPNTFSFTN